MNGREHVEYLRSYVNNFGLLPHVHLGVAVVRVVRAPDSHKWRLTLQNHEKSWSRDFEKIAVCTGSNQKPYMPVMEGQQESKIEALHSQGYKG